MMNRRSMLKRTSALPFCAVGSTMWFDNISCAFGQQLPVAKFHAPKPMMVGLNAYSFAKELNNIVKRRGPGMSLDQLLDYCADRKHRFDAVDITGYYFPNYSAKEATVPADKFVDQIRRRAADLGLAISGTGIGNSFTGVPFDREEKKASYSARTRGVIEPSSRKTSSVSRPGSKLLHA